MKILGTTPARLLAAVALAACAPGHALAGAAVSIQGEYVVDAAGVVRGGTDRTIRVLDNLRLAADVDLDATAGWTGGGLHVALLNTSGDRPNDAAGTLQGVNNIEVARDRLRLFEAYVEQRFGGDRGSVVIGLYDVNSEFYSNESAALLIAPAFGIGSELAATGPNGPSIFPSTALAVRLRWRDTAGRYVQAAVINARAGVPGDPGGVETRFDDGVLAIAEAGVGDASRLAVGGWTYSKRQDDWRDVTAVGAPVRRRAFGGYVLGEANLRGEAGTPGHMTAFARLGVSDAATSPFAGGWQAGILMEAPVPSRPASRLSLGVNQGFLSRRERRNGADLGRELGSAETAFEATYVDTVGVLSIQPDVQYVVRPAGDRRARDVLVATLRLSLSF